MKIRKFWLEKIEDAWKQRSIVWVSGVRRVGKTTLCQSLPDSEYFDCELPRTRRLMDARRVSSQSCGINGWCWMRSTGWGILRNC
ncbi:MAG: hypothetical protein ACE5GZ_03210 [Gammaproteobacteria bacterium]